MDRHPNGVMGFAARVLVALALVAGAAGHVLAAEPVRLDGAVRQPLVFDDATLRALPKTSVAVDFETGKGREAGSYGGVLLWALVEKAGLQAGEGKNAALRRTLLVTGSDGYAVALAIGEIDPHYGGKPVLLAYESGEPAMPLDAPRLVVPGDAHGGRNVRGVVHIEVK